MKQQGTYKGTHSGIDIERQGEIIGFFAANGQRCYIFANDVPAFIKDLLDNYVEYQEERAGKAFQNGAFAQSFYVGE